MRQGERILATETSERSIFAERLVQTRMGRAAIAAVAWTAIGLVFALPSLSTGGGRMALLGSFSQWWAWGIVAPLILWADRRLPLSGRQILLRIAAHLLLSLLFTSAYIYVFAAVRALFGIGHWGLLMNSMLLVKALQSMFLWSWLVYWLIVGGGQVSLYYKHYLSAELRLERLERSFSQARLNALRMQLDPHFLFNALNTISSHVERDPRLTRRMIEHLGDLLRLSLESKDKQEVPLAEEMAFLDHYLAIQKIRFGSQLRVEIHIAPEVRYAWVPSLIIQPLVENAIRHGISRRGSGGTVTVSAAQTDGRLEIRVQDDGVGLPPGWSLENSAGLGLSVTRERIAGIHPNGDGRFAVRRRPEGGAEAEISLPLRVKGEEVHDSDAA
jgi:signal transduction histidine kinase